MINTYCVQLDSLSKLSKFYFSWRQIKSKPDHVKKRSSWRTRYTIQHVVALIIEQKWSNFIKRLRIFEKDFIKFIKISLHTQRKNHKSVGWCTWDGLDQEHADCVFLCWYGVQDESWN